MEDAGFIEDKEEEVDNETAEIDLNNPENELALIERNFQVTLAEIEENAEAAKYGEEFSRLFEKFRDTYNNYKELQTKYDELLEDNQEKHREIELRIKLTETDQNTIDELKNEIQYSWRLADTAHAREQVAQETIDSLRRQVDTLSNELDLKNKIAQESDHEMGAAAKKKQQTLIREKERLISEVTQLNKKLQNALEYQNDLEQKNTDADNKIAEMTEQIENQNIELDRFKRLKDKLDDEINELNYTIADKDMQIDSLNKKMETHLENMEKLENQMKDERNNRERVQKENANLLEKFTKLQETHNTTSAQFDKLQKTFTKQNAELKDKINEINELKIDLSKLKKQKESCEKHTQQLEYEKSDLIKLRNQLREQIKTFEKQIESSKKKAMFEQKELANLKKEKEGLINTIMKHENVMKDQMKTIEMQEQNRQKLEADFDHLMGDNEKQLRTIKSLEFDKNRAAEERILLNKKIEQGLDEINIKKAEINDLNKNLKETTTKLNQQQSLYDTMRAERNQFEKSLQESLSETEQLKQKLKISNHQIEQMKEDIIMKEQELIKEENIFKQLLKEKENLRTELNSANDRIKALKYEISELEAEQKRLHKTITENDRLNKEQSKTIEQLMNERDVLGAQIVRRNDEITLLNEKNQILQSTLQNGDKQYEQRLSDIKLLKIEIKRLRQEQHLNEKTIKSSIDFKREILLLERDLMKSRLKCRTLEEELQNPINIHRWRKLEGSDPDTFELLQKIQLLQKRLLKQSDEAVEREKCLKQTEQLYLNLKQTVVKQTSPDTLEELNQAKRALKEQEKHLKCLISELNMAELHAKEYQSDLQRITEELHDLKRKYIALKKQQKMQQSPVRGFSRDMHHHNNGTYNTGNQIKYAGGGFRMSAGNI